MITTTWGSIATCSKRRSTPDWRVSARSISREWHSKSSFKRMLWLEQEQEQVLVARQLGCKVSSRR